MIVPADRYGAMFARLGARGEGAFVPFTVLGDPDPQRSREVLTGLVESGADALELGLAFSDPVADGPALQAAAGRALAAGTRPEDALALVAEVRARHRSLPIGLLVYANLIEAHGDGFYRAASRAGADSVLIADVPELESAPWREAASAAGLRHISMAPPNAPGGILAAIAARPGGYVYVASRPGVTGADSELQRGAGGVIARLRALGAPPALLGFGVSVPAHVEAALALGAAGVISGSAVAERISGSACDTRSLAAELEHFVRTMKAATRRPTALV